MIGLIKKKTWDWVRAKLRSAWGLSKGPSGLVHVGTFTVKVGADEFRVTAVGGTFVLASSANSPIELAPKGTPEVVLNTNAMTLASGTVLGWGSSSYLFPDLFLRRNAANVLAQRNGTAAQESRVYNTFTDASNGEWAMAKWDANICYFGTNRNGSGTMRIAALLGNSIRFYCGSSYDNASTRWLIDASGHFVAGATGSFDIGYSSGNQPRNVFIGGYQRFGAVATGSLPAASTAGAGAVIFDSTVGKLKVSNGTSWETITSS